MQTISARVTGKERAGRAPYNFIPLPEKWRSWEKPPLGDRYHTELLTGEIRFSLAALTGFYTRGMWSLDEYRKQPKEKQNPGSV